MAFKLAKRLLSAAVIVTMLLGTSASALAAESDKTGIGGFVARVYRTVLNREYEQGGFDFWVKGLKKGELDATSLVNFFINSDEFKAKGTSTEDYVTVLYRAMMDREPEAGGFKFWVDQIDSGMTRNKALSLFIGSEEFTGICNRYHVTRGALTITAPADLDTPKSVFVTSAYRAILDREPDEGGLNNWVRYLQGGNSAVDFVQQFLSSREFVNKNVDDREYIGVLYKALLGRGAAESEIDSWYAPMKDHNVSRKYIFKQIAYSQEFKNRCDACGVNVGTVTLDEARDTNMALNDFVMATLSALLDRQCSTSDLNHWAGLMLDSMTSKKFIGEVVKSEEFRSKNYSDIEFIGVIYRAALGRNPSDKENIDHLSLINAKGRDAFLDIVFGSTEFYERCKKNGVSAVYRDGWNSSAAGKVYFDDGLVSGWKRIDGRRYYFDASHGNAAVTGWKYIDGLKYYFNGDGSLCQDVRSVLGSRSEYYLKVNCTTNTVMVYAKGDNGTFDIPVTAFICSSSAGGVTPSGTFKLERLQAWRELMGDVWGQYCSRITGNYLFHSVWYYEGYNPNSQSVRQYNNLGSSVSHGCIRLTTADAKWIFDNCNGCTVTVFYSSEQAPFDRPVPPPTTVIRGDYSHDPTDIWS